LHASARIAGTSDSPKFAGAIQLEKGMMRLEGYPMVFENIELNAPLQKDGLQIESLTAVVGGGRVQATGHVFWNQQLTNAIEVHVEGKNVAINYPQDLRSALNTDLTFRGGKEQYALTGKVDIVRSAYREDFDPRARLVHTLMAHKKELLPDSDSVANKIDLNIDVQTLRDAIMDNNMGRLRASGKLTVTGTLYEPLLTGRARIKEGSYLDFENHTYTVEEATLDYRNSGIFDPEIRIRLSTEVEYQEEMNRQQCDVELTATGNLKEPDIQSHSVCFSYLCSYQIYSLLLK
jgi:autotransporter translocation and assembly factor TamB